MAARCSSLRGVMEKPVLYCLSGNFVRSVPERRKNFTDYTRCLHIRQIDSGSKTVPKLNICRAVSGAVCARTNGMMVAAQIIKETYELRRKNKALGGSRRTPGCTESLF